MLTDNIDACRRLLLASVRKMFRMIAIKDSDGSTDHYEFMPTIEAWIKVCVARLCVVAVVTVVGCDLIGQQVLASTVEGASEECVRVV